MRKRGNIKPRHAAKAPMLIMRGMRNDELELRERLATQALIGGWAEAEHMQTVIDMSNVMMLAGSTDEHRRWAWTYCHDVVNPALRKIAQRYTRTKVLSVTTGEREILRAFVTRYREFWLRQPLELYEAACHALTEHYAQMIDRQEAA